jgi:hypothetical protein
MIFGKWDERTGSRSDSRPVVNAVAVASPVSAVPAAPSPEPKKSQPMMVERPAE